MSQVSSHIKNQTNGEERVRAMYSQLRYPGLDPAGNATYVRHRRHVYHCMGMEVDGFFRDKVVLDAGCGTGEETLFLASLGPAKVIGIDTSDGSLDSARQAAAKAGVTNVEFRLVSVLDQTAFADESFDYVSSLGCIHHTPDMPGAFANLTRLVRPGGHLCTFIYNSFGHFFYNLECDILDRWVGQDIESRVVVGRRFFDWRRHQAFYREGVASSPKARIYDKYGVLFRESLTLKTLLHWYQRAGFDHAGSYPMYLSDMLEAVRARSVEGRWPDSAKGRLARGLAAMVNAGSKRQWSWGRRTLMQGLLLGLGVWDYGSAFRVLGRKGD